MNVSVQMQRVPVLCCLALTACLWARAQQTAEPQDVPLKLQVNVNRILVPVVVHDRQGRVVGDLKKEDFQVFDNDKPHPISSFTLEKRAAAEGRRENTAVSNQPPPAAQNAAATATPPAQRFVVLVFDDLHLSPENMAQAKQAAAKVLAGALTGQDNGAVISLSQRTNSGLTRDHAHLQDAILSLQSRRVLKADHGDCPDIGYYQADLMENKRDSTAMGDAVRKVLNCDPGIDPKYQLAAAQNEAESAARRALALGHQDALSTYATIAAFVRTMATLPGERTMVLVSPGFLRIEPEALTAESQLMNLAAESNVTISALDARGLYTTEMTAGDRSPALAGPSLVENSDYRSSADKLAEAPMSELADATGGTFFQNSNDLGEGFKRLAEAPEVEYVLELSPENFKPDGAYHRLRVKVDREGLVVQARHGYVIPKPQKNGK